MKLIDADALIKQIEADSKGNEGQYGDEWLFMGTIENAPSIDIEPKRGEWKISNLPKGEMKYCSECGFGQYIKDERMYNFCPNCGADMGERKESE